MLKYGLPMGAFLVSFTSVSAATNAIIPADESLIDLLRPVYDAFAHGRYVYAGALALVLAVAMVRRYLGPHVAWLRGDLGGTLLTLIASFGASLAMALAGGVGVTASMAWHALSVAFVAAGGYSMIKRLVVKPLLVPLMAKAPAWLQPILMLVLWIFDQPQAKADAIDRSVEAGETAVGAASPDGAGKPTEVP